jgi:3D (Asp-Asp-Asp) domain-containing protein
MTRSVTRTKAFVALSLALAAGCSTMGSHWIAEPLTPNDEPLVGTSAAPRPVYPPPPRPRPLRSRTLGETPPGEAGTAPATGTASTGSTTPVASGRSLGTFRNTYYDFPSEADFEGPTVGLMSKSCGTIATVPRAFFEALCVQGSGNLRRGSTVSFARRDCECAPICPKTNQKICFDELEAREFPWGRGATGKAITPLLSVAVDTSVIPLGTPVYVPELDGMPRDVAGTTAHDGCFVAQDRGLKVVGQHIDIFTGHRSLTALWNGRVPSNRGVTVVLDVPRCARAGQ